MNKRQLRLLMRQRRESLSPAMVQDSGKRWAAAFMAWLEKMPPSEKTPLSNVGHHIIALYVPFRGEVDVLQLVPSLKELGIEIALPRINQGDNGQGNNSMDFCMWLEAQPLQQGAFGLLQPPANLPSIIPSLVVLPLLAVDDAGNRLGWGKGYYDRTLADKKYAGTWRVGAAYSWQKLPYIPHDEWDLRLHQVITEES
ncbi:MAG: 5-formyltetrahydrofolate cyclo-ligase [Alphaproteobacteria bacterium]